MKTSFHPQAWSAVLTAAMLLVAAMPAYAGRSCEQKPLTPRAVEQGLELAARTLARLEDSGHQVVLLARAGQDLRKYGLQFSHLGFAYRHPDGSGGYTWRVLHKLNHCGTAIAALYRQGLGEFFLDDLWRHDAAFIAPAPEVQTRLVALLRDDRTATALHHRPYNLVSYVWGQKYQQSNQWMIEMLAQAASPAIASRIAAQSWLQQAGYQPTALTLGPLTRLGGRLTAANVAFDDHPPTKRFSDRIETVTADSVFRWMERLYPQQRLVSVRIAD